MVNQRIAAGDVQSELGVRKTYIDARRHSARRSRKNNLQGCDCEQCGRCLENARWERIYRERFLDPEYYAKTRIRLSSPLADL
jgi:hypothetical protein